MKYLIFIFSFMSLNACSASTDCYEKSSQAEMTSCSIEKLNMLESKLNEKITNLSELLENDEKFSLSNDAWLTYMDAHCDSVSNIYFGGSIHKFVLSECKAKVTQMRINSIEGDYKDTIDIITKGAP